MVVRPVVWLVIIKLQVKIIVSVRTVKLESCIFTIGKVSIGQSMVIPIGYQCFTNQLFYAIDMFCTAADLFCLSQI